MKVTKNFDENDIKEWLKDDKEYQVAEYVKTSNKFYGEVLTSVFDCHHKSIQEAYVDLKDFIERHYENSSKFITVITGKSGDINREFKTWMEKNKFVRYISQNDNGGSWKVFIKDKEK